VAGLVIFGQVFGPQQVARVFGFSSFYFVGWGGLLFVWVLFCFFISNLHCNGQSSLVL
jgi:hypothetical protein